MIKLKKNHLIFFFAISLTLILSSFVLAADNGKPLEVDYPEAFGEPPTTTKTALPDYIKYIFQFSIIIAGLIAFGSLIYGGFSYLMSTGSPAKISDSKDQILSAFLGLIILLCSYLILHTVNPQLTIIDITKQSLCNCELPSAEWPEECKEYCEGLANPFRALGVYLLTDDHQEGEKCGPGVEENNCLWLTQDINLGVYDFDDKAKKIKFTNSEEHKFWAILHEDPNYEGQCRISFKKPAEEFQDIQAGSTLGKVDKPSSVTIFRKAETGEGFVKICENPSLEAPCHTFKSSDIPISIPILIPKDLSIYGLDKKVRSIQIGGNYLVVLLEKNPIKEDSTGKCAVFRMGDPDLYDLKSNPIGKCGLGCLLKNPLTGKCLFNYWQESCASAILIYPIK